MQSDNSKYCCVAFAGDSLAFYGQLGDKELKAFEKRWLEAYGSEQVCVV